MPPVDTESKFDQEEDGEFRFTIVELKVPNDTPLEISSKQYWKFKLKSEGLFWKCMPMSACRLYLK